MRGLTPLLADEGLRESLASAVPSLLLTSCFSVEPQEVNFGVLCHSGDRSGLSERASDEQSEGLFPHKDIIAAPGVNSVTGFKHTKNGRAPGRGTARHLRLG